MTEKLHGLSSDKFKDLAIKYSQDKTSVEKIWQDFFKSFDVAGLVGEKSTPQVESTPAYKRVKRRPAKSFDSFMIENLNSLSTQEQAFMTQFANEFHPENSQLTQAVSNVRKVSFFEEFLSKKFIGVKRFSLEGLESSIILLQEIKELGLKNGVTNINVSMAHRGRLNMLANYLEKPYSKVISGFLGFDEFNGNFEGDVKYHLGYKNTFTKGSNELEINLHNNPSHLEAANSVCLGYTYGLQEHRTQDKVIPIIMHGDSAFAGQGVVSECLNMAYLEGYDVGGTIHIIMNNKVGFTAAEDESSSVYSTNLAKSIDAPIIHVQADDLENIIKAVNLAYEYRQKFNKDVFIDLIGYRKHGHNEGDDPSFTNPLMYKDISKKESVYKLFKNYLVNHDLTTWQNCKQDEDDFFKQLQDALKEAEKIAAKQKSEPNNYKFDVVENEKDICIESNTDEALIDRAKECMNFPIEGFTINRKLEKLFHKRYQSLAKNNEDGIDWGTAENLCYADLVAKGTSVRLSGQDSKRGTFSHRHLELIDQNTEEGKILWDDLSKNNSRIRVYNSPVSEYSIIGFEYGYNLSKFENNQKNLTIWEAQFGDFANGGQIMFDQFLFSAGQKWNEKNNLAILLPHGFEGQGPEHSSARIERFLSLAGQNNMIIANPTSASQMYHILNKQPEQTVPLVMFTPKSLLRLKDANSNFENFTDGKFENIRYSDKLKKYKKVIFCSGKIYYSLINKKNELKNKDTLILSVEMLYPLPVNEIAQILSKTKADKYMWVQEEPRNVGSFMYIQDQFINNFDIKLEYVGIAEKASPAVGNLKLHHIQQDYIINKAFNSKAKVGEK